MTERFINSVKTSTILWMSLWALLVLNMLVIIVLIRGYSWLLMVGSVLILAGGLLSLQRLAHTSEEENDIDADLQRRLDQLMDEIRPHCEVIFDKQVKHFIEPIEREFELEISRGLNWLWEEVDSFYNQVMQSAQEGRSIIQLIDILKEEKMKLVKKLQEKVQSVLTAMQEIHNSRDLDQASVQKKVQERLADFMNSMTREKEYFYDYVYKVLVEQARIQGIETEMAEFLSPTRLGQQFTVVVEKSLEGRVNAFHNSLIIDLENFSADVVGHFQNATAQVLNDFRDMEDLLNRLIEVSQNDSGVLLRRLEEYLKRIRELEERAGELLATLAWQDVMVEKRWNEIQERLFAVKDQVIENVDNTVLEYIEEVLDQAIPGLSAMVRDPENAIFYKSLLDAELIYQVYTGKKLPVLLDDGVYSLLQFVRPLELLTSRAVRLTDEGLQRIKSWKPHIKKGSHQLYFDRVCMAVEKNEPEALYLLERVFPRQFYQFASSPYIKNKPDNVNQAAWAVFSALIDNESLTEEIFLLTGLMLAAHQIRNRHIQPFNSIPLELENTQEIHLMRTISYRIISIILQVNMSGITRISLPGYNSWD